MIQKTKENVINGFNKKLISSKLADITAGTFRA